MKIGILGTGVVGKTVGTKLAKLGHDVRMGSRTAGGETAKAKAQVIDLLKTGFGWKEVIDLGDITAARSQEMLLTLWLRLFTKLQTPNVNVRVAR